MNTIRLEMNPLERNAASDDPWLLENVTAEGVNGSYEIIATDLLAYGGESQIYKAKRLSDGKILIAKVYIASAGGRREKAERTAIRNSLLKIEDPVSYGLLPLLDIFKIENDEEDKADVDIMPFCEEGSLSSADYKELRQIIIPGLMKALHHLHEHGWVHRDVKPENIYVLDGKIVLGDFGTTVKVSNDSSVTNQTQARRGTPGYTAREVRSGYSKIASDYFSLGCTIATLYNQGEHVYATELKEGNEGAFFNHLKQFGFPLNCPDSEADMQTLVDALTLDDENSRAGYDAVMQWLDDPKAFVKKWKSCRQGMSQAFKMRFEERDYFSEKDLTEAFLQNWEEALDFFYEDDTFVDYVKVNLHAGCNEAERILRNPPKSKLEKDFCFAKFLHYFNKLNDYVNPPIYWRAHKYDSLFEIAATIKTRETKAWADILDLLRSGFLSWKLEVSKQENEEDGKTLETVKGIEKYINTQPFLAMETFSLLLNNSKVQERRTTEQIVSDILSNKDIFHKLCALYCVKNTDIKIKTEVFSTVFAPLIQNGHSASMFELANTFDKEPYQVKRAINAYLTFEGICTDKRFIRRHFCEYGPHAYLYWLTKNIHLYEISSNEMRNTASKIRAFAFSDTKPIKAQLDEFARLKVLHDEFYNNYQDSILNTALGNMGGKTVKAKALDAFYVTCDDTMVNRNLLSVKKIPIGHYRALGYLPDKCLVEDNVTKILDDAASEVTNILDTPVSVQNTSDRKLFRTPFVPQNYIMRVPPLPLPPPIETKTLDTYMGGALNRISGGLSFLFGMYCTNTLKNGNVVQYAIDTVNNMKYGTSQLGKVAAKTKSPAYFHMYLYNMIDGTLQSLLREPSLKKWDELKGNYKKAFDSEYDELLKSRAVSYNILAQRCPNDYRPIWYALKEKTADFDVDKLFHQVDSLRNAKDNFNRAKNQFDSAVSKIESKKISKIGSFDFDQIIRNAENTQNVWEKLKNAFDSYNQKLLAEFQAAKSKAGADASVLQSTWDNYTESINAYKSTDYMSQIKYWKSEKWEAEGLCKYCGGKLGLFGTCKSCGMKTS